MLVLVVLVINKKIPLQGLKIKTFIIKFQFITKNDVSELYTKAYINCKKYEIVFVLFVSYF